MKRVTINLYSFNELSKEAKENAITEHQNFLLSVGDEYNRKATIENIEINGYLFFKNGELAHCTTYTGEHEKSGITELHLYGETFTV